MGRLRTWMSVPAIVLLAASLSLLGVAHAQSLAEVAQAEAARRKTAPKATKVYTNADLQPPPASRQAPPSAQPVPPLTPAPQAAEEPEEEADPRRDEEYWRTRITEARERLERTTLFAEALQSRINALTTDFVNRDDPAQRAVIGQERQRALDELARVEKEIKDFTQAIADIEEEARRAGVPPGWLR